MGLYRSEAVVLRSTKYREADSLLTLLTKKKGKVPAIAKGVRKPHSRLRGGVQVFTLNDMLLAEGRNLDIVTQSECLEAFTPLQEDIKAMTAASYWSELVSSLIPEGEKDENLFKLTLAGFHALCLFPEALTVRALEIKLLSLLGYGLILDRCVECDRKLGDEKKPGDKIKSLLSVSVRLGGLVCAPCLHNLRPTNEAVPFSPEAAGVWTQLVQMDLTKLQRLKVSKQTLSLLNRTMESFLLWQLDYPLKSRPILDKFIK